MKMLEQLGIRYQVLEDSGEVARAAAEYILTKAREAIAKQSQFKLVLAGGSTPQATYQLLATADAEWEQWHIYFGDERCLPVDDSERNSHMAYDAWLDYVPIPREQIHSIDAERGAEEAAASYSGLIESVMPFDLVLLGMGDDGHTASLFPAQQHDPAAWVVPVHNAPKPPPNRVSLSTRALSKTQSLLLLVTGAEKHRALQSWSRGEELPVATLHPPNPIMLLLDKVAAGA